MAFSTKGNPTPSLTHRNSLPSLLYISSKIMKIPWKVNHTDHWLTKWYKTLRRRGGRFNYLVTPPLLVRSLDYVKGWKGGSSCKYIKWQMLKFPELFNLQNLADCFCSKLSSLNISTTKQTFIFKIICFFFAMFQDSILAGVAIM